jgi:hypothetical protein
MLCLILIVLLLNLILLIDMTFSTPTPHYTQHASPRPWGMLERSMMGATRPLRSAVLLLPPGRSCSETHLLRLIEKHISFAFVREKLKASYSDTASAQQTDGRTCNIRSRSTHSVRNRSAAWTSLPQASRSLSLPAGYCSTENPPREHYPDKIGLIVRL